MDRIHPKALHDRQEQGGKDQDRRGHIHKGPRDQQDHVHDQQDDDVVIRQAEQCRRYRLGDLEERHDPPQDVGHADQEHHHAAHLRAVHHDLPEGLYRDVLVADA